MTLRRPTTRAKFSPHPQEDIIYAWPVGSMTNRQTFGGKTVTYEVVMYNDGALYCNCAGFQFAKDPKTCKHCNHVKEEAEKLFSDYQRGDFSNFQVIEETVTIPTVSAGIRKTTVVSVPGNVPPPTPESQANPNIRRRYGRVIEV